MCIRDRYMGILKNFRAKSRIMPKVVESYVLERKIGSGQFGEVFKGYDKTTNRDVAVKVVKRELIRGKFMDLLENEIKVLRTCNNINIIKLYDLKKTQNNFYLVLEYCNEGDLSDYLKAKKNSNVLLHERNKYVFLASVSEDAISLRVRYSDIASFLLIKKLFILIGKLKLALDTKTNHLSLEIWEEFSRSSEFRDITQYISQEHEVFKVYFESMFNNLSKIIRNDRDPNLTIEIRDALNLDVRGNINGAYTKALTLYVMDLMNSAKASLTRSEEEAKRLWAHTDQILDCLQLDETFRFQVTDKAQFNFKLFYEEPKNLDLPVLIARVEAKFKKLFP
eukprot:TRINITY_DN6381_c0_g1_i3.p1 TRINITY_DN6381_c0_g1~~TRINITY_DN6381_c0_g1_i3.p1  ORF type:complete len:337 (-),score=62.55 TRINITY_DN6381_c0_g1_i3:18-1028(-)